MAARESWSREGGRKPSSRASEARSDFSHSGDRRDFVRAALPLSQSTRKLRVREDGEMPSPPRDCKAAL